MPQVIKGDSYRSTDARFLGENKALKKGKDEPRPVSLVGAGQGGSLIAFSQGHGGPQS